jgi:flagellar motor switch protein FliG
MDISVNKMADDVYEVLLGDNRVEITASDLEHLHSQLSAILRPETVAEKENRHAEFLSKLVTANDSGIQSLLHLADHDDVVILLTCCEEDETLKKKIYGNMTDNAIKMFVEDMMFLMREGVPNYSLDEAMTRLIKTVEELIENETLTFETT